jgi:hypothetical protein
LKKNSYIVILICFIFSLKIKAAYLAGDITYKWLYGYTYEVKLTTYTSIDSGSSNDNYCTDTICFGDGTGTIVYRSNGAPGNCSIAHNGVQILPTINLNEYVTNHTYPGPGNYKICFESLNRALGVINIPNSVNQKMALESQLVIPTFGNQNSSVEFGYLPFDTICMNNGCLTYNNSATDLNSDSLSYELISSIGIAGYSIPNSGTNGTFTVDVFGTINWCVPQIAGIYNVALKINEWKKDDDGNYFKIGYVVRELLFTVDNCTGIQNYDKENLVSIYPNPTNTDVEVKFLQNNNKIKEIELLDLYGKSIETISTNQDKFKLNTNSIKPGVYFIKITENKNTIIYKKVVKQ